MTLRNLFLIFFLLLVPPLASHAGNTPSGASPLEQVGTWMGDQLGSYVSSGCLPTVPSSSMTLPAFACSGAIHASNGSLRYVQQAAKSVTLAGSDGRYLLALHSDQQTAASGWTRTAGTHYLWRKSGGNDPPRPLAPFDAQLLADITVVGGVITAIGDYRRPISYAQRGVYALNDPLYGGVCDGTGADGSGTDNSAAWNAVAGALRRGGGVLQVPAGYCLFGNQPGALGHGTMVRGEGQNVSYLVRAYTEVAPAQGFIDMDAAHAGIDNAGGGVEKLTIWAQSGTTGGTAINMQSSDLIAQGQLVIDWVRVSGSGTWAYNVRADGSLKTTAPSGIRIITLRQTALFQATAVGVLLIGVNHGMLDQIGIYTGIGVDLVVDGGTGGTVQTNDIVISCEFCPVVEIGKTQPTQAIHFNTTYTVSLTVSTHLTCFSYVGTVGIFVGTHTIAAPCSTGVGVTVSGKGLFGVGGPTTGGAHLETSDGLTFPLTQVPSANNNTLDDYEKGLFTPRVVGSTTLGAGTYVNQKGWSTKVGNIVHFSIYLAWSAHTGTGNLVIDSLPYPVSTDESYFVAIAVWASNVPAGADRQLMARLDGSDSTIKLFSYDPTVSVGGILQTGIISSGQLVLSGSYRATQ